MKTHSICHVPHHLYVNLILLVVGEYLKSLLLLPTRRLLVLFNISMILVQASTRSWPVCDRIKNSDGTGPDWDHFGRNRTGLQARKKLTGFNRIGRIDRICRILTRF